MSQQPTLTPGRPVPANVAQLAAASGLGAFRRMYVPKRRNWLLIIFMIIVGLATAIVLVGLWLLWFIIFRTPNLSRAQAARRVYLYDRGFIIADRPEQPLAYRFDEINVVTQKIVSRRTYGVETARTYLYTIICRDGRTAKLTEFWAGIAELGGYVNESVSAALMPGALAAIEHGQGLQFGDITINAGGIASPRKSLPWSEVKDVKIANGYVNVRAAGKFLSMSTTPVAKLPNLPLFLTLVERFWSKTSG